MVSGRMQAGQAIVEYAVLLVFVTLLIAGGVELGVAAFNGNRSGAAAEQGVEAWSYAAGTSDPSVPFEHFASGIYTGLGDHTPARFTRPSCGVIDTDYDAGLPADAVSPTGTYDAVYLFNPKPIDITNCVGQDGTDPDLSRRSVLIELLPRLNRHLYPLYALHCENAAGDEISCADTANVTAQTLRLPGKLDPVLDVVQLGFLDTDPDSPTFQEPIPGDSPRPAMEVFCAEPESKDPTALFRRCDSAAAPENICHSTTVGAPPLRCRVRIWVRFRHIFYAFVQAPFVLWQRPLPPEALDQLDLGPGGAYGGVLGGEVGAGGVRLFHRTFQWCYETARGVDVARYVSRHCNQNPRNLPI